MSFSISTTKACLPDAAKTSQPDAAKTSQSDHLSYTFVCPNQYYESYQKYKGLQKNLPAAILFVASKDINDNGNKGSIVFSKAIAQFENKPTNENIKNLECLYISITRYFKSLDFEFV